MPSTGEPMSTLCELRGIQLRFKQAGGKQLRVLEDLHLDVRADEILCIIGVNGSGKSSLLRTIAGTQKPTKGEVRYQGEKLEGLNPGVAMVLQSFALYPWMTVEENVRVVLRARDLPEAEVRQRAHEAIRKVGLEGFEEAFPRELSRGTKQRVGVARALSVDPEILVMDEPFSQVDALTAEALRAEILDIWQDAERNPKTIVMVSHSIREAVSLADRIAILDGPPGTIRALVDVPLPRPRDSRSRDYIKLVDKVHDIIASTELPDIEVTTVSPAMAEQMEDIIEPLPEVQSADILGLLEYLDGHGGHGDLFSIANAAQVPFQRMLAVVKAAEDLEFVDTPKRQVHLTDLGRTFVAADMDTRKDVWRAQLLEMRLFRVVHELIGLRDGELSKDELIQELAMRLPQEDPEATFDTVVAWGRFGELFAYREERETLTFE